MYSTYWRHCIELSCLGWKVPLTLPQTATLSPMWWMHWMFWRPLQWDPSSVSWGACSVLAAARFRILPLLATSSYKSSNRWNKVYNKSYNCFLSTRCCTHLQALVHHLPQFSMPGKIDVLLVKHAVLTEKLQLDLVRRFITEELKITVNCVLLFKSHIPVRRRDLRIESKVFYSERTATYGICFVFSLLLNILYCTR